MLQKGLAEKASSVYSSVMQLHFIPVVHTHTPLNFNSQDIQTHVFEGHTSDVSRVRYNSNALVSWKQGFFRKWKYVSVAEFFFFLPQKVSASYDQTIRVWDLETLSCRAKVCVAKQVCPFSLLFVQILILALNCLIHLPSVGLWCVVWWRQRSHTDRFWRLQNKDVVLQ